MATSPLALGETLITGESIHRRVVELAAEIDRAYSGAVQPVVLVCVLTGALIFTADLVRALHMPMEIDCIAVRSYGGGTDSPGEVELVKDINTPLRDRDVLIVEDIVDSGHTVAFLMDHLKRMEPRSLRVVALLDKPARRARTVSIDWRGFDIPDRFVVGYGLDHDGRHRNLPDIRVLDGA